MEAYAAAWASHPQLDKFKAMPQIIIRAKGQTATHELRRGLGLQALAERNPNTGLEFDCRGADCGICIIRILQGMENLSEPTPQERDFLAAMRAEPVERLACQCRVMGDVVIEIEDFVG